MSTISKVSRELQPLLTATVSSWVSLPSNGRKVISVGATYGETLEASRRAGHKHVVVMKLPKAWHLLSTQT